MKAFERRLATGRLTEGRIAKWLRQRGNTVIPAYEIELSQGKGPQVFTPTEELIAPDLLVWKDGRTRWIEAKCKTVFSWDRSHGPAPCWVTGIDQHHYNHYQSVLSHFDFTWDVWLLFLHESSVPSEEDRRYGCPETCPTGLFGERLAELVFREHHRDLRWGKSGMVYWSPDSFSLQIPLAELPNA